MATNKRLLRTAIGVGVLLAARAAIRKIRAYDLSDKIVLVTGGSRGLGLVIARQLVKENAKVVICARDADELERARHELAGLGADVLTVTCDLTVQAEVEEMVRQVRSRLGSIDVLINNAGIIQVGPSENMSLLEYQEAMQVHFYAPLYTMLAVVPEMKHRKEGRIVNIASIGGKVSLPHLVPYSASKFALVGLSKGMRSELAKDGILVTTVCPGLVRTGSPRNVVVKGQHQAEYAWFKMGDSLPFLSASAEDAAAQIITACKRGDAELVITVPGKALALINELFPEFSADLFSLINRFLPEPAPSGEGNERLKGYESESRRSQSTFTRLSDEAAERNNELTAKTLEPSNGQIDATNQLEEKRSGSGI